MGRRRRGNRPGMTLFAFQDIIMSTSGIVIMIVLLLTLELVQRTGQAQPVQKAFDSTAIAQEIERTQQQVEQFKRQLIEADALIQAVADVTPQELAARVKGLQESNARAAAALDELLRQQADLEQSAADVAQRRQRLQELQVKLDERHRELARKQSELKTLQLQDRPLFSLARGSRYVGWIVVVAKGRIEAAPIGQAAAPLVFEPGGGFLGSGSAAADFLEWATSQPQENAYFYLLIRPDGVDEYDRVVLEFTLKDVRYGLDLVGQEAELLDPERGTVE